MVAHSLARSPRGPAVQVQWVLWVLRCAMADVAGAGKYHSFSGINTDKAVMDNLEAPCLGSDESTKMPKDAKHICSTINVYIYIIHYNPTYYYISTTLSVGDFSQKRCPKNGAPSEALLSPFKMTGGVWIPDFKSTSKTVFVIPWQNWCLWMRTNEV